MTKVINLYGGPGIGKSTLAARLYSFMAENKFKVELAREYVKDWLWSGRQVGKYDQMYFLVQQFKRESILYNKVDYVITDSPFTLAAFYGEYYGQQQFLTTAANAMRKMAEEDGVKYNDYIITRSTEYEPLGRYETEEQALLIDSKIEDYLISNTIQPTKINNNYLEIYTNLMGGNR